MKFTSLTGLKRALQEEMYDAMDEVAKKSFADAQANARGFYAGGSPVYYDRTGKFGNSPAVEYPSGTGDNLQSAIYLDDTYEYETGTYSTDKVFHEAEIGGSGIKGTPGTWKRIEEDIQKNIDTVFGGRFRQKT